jgi:hypothetical protein
MVLSNEWRRDRVGSRRRMSIRRIGKAREAEEKRAY